MLVTRDGEPIQIELIVDRLRQQRERVLADDEIGLVIYVGDLTVYSLEPTESGEFLARHVTEISRPRFATRVLRKQIGATVRSGTVEAVFVVKDAGALRKVRAERLEPGMVLASGDKVYR